MLMHYQGTGRDDMSADQAASHIIMMQALVGSQTNNIWTRSRDNASASPSHAMNTAARAAIAGFEQVLSDS